jgi:hypothetical protein
MAAQGPARVAADLKRLQRAIAASQLPPYTAIDLPGDDVGVWRLHMGDCFDEDTAGGAALNADLKALGCTLELELRFPARYPADPPFVRVVRPRCGGGARVVRPGIATACCACCARTPVNGRVPNRLEGQ